MAKEKPQDIEQKPQDAEQKTQVVEPKPQESPEIQNIRAPYLAQIKALEERAQNPLPTPPIGTSVQWYRNGETKPHNATAGMVTKHIRPGVLGVVTFGFRTNPQHQDNVMYCRDPQALAKGDKNVQRHGVWDYVRNGPVNKSDYAIHQAEIAQQIDRNKQYMESQVNEYLDRQAFLAQQSQVEQPIS